MIKDLSKIEKIEKMLDAGSSHELIQQVLDLNHDVDSILEAAEREKGLLTSLQTARVLNQKLKGRVKGVFDYQKVNRLRKDGLLTPVNPNPSKREGYRYEIEEVKRFVEEQLVTKQQLLKQQKEDSERIASLEQELANAKKEIATLMKKNKALENEAKEQQKNP